MDVMTRIVSRKDIPEGGDIVDDVKYNKDRSLGCVIFDSGKKLFFHVNPVEFGRKKSETAESTDSTESAQSHSTNEMDKNTPNDPEYQANVQATLARMRGIPVEQVQEEMACGQDPGAAMTLGTTPTKGMEDFEDRKAAILEASESRVSRMAEQLSRESGGRLESTFSDGANTVETGSI
jgi:hypothetical protein